MKIDKNSIRFKVIIPIIFSILLVISFMFFAVYKISENVAAEKHLFFLLPFVGLAFVLMIGISLFIFNRNFRSPLKEIIQDLKEGRQITATGLSELDTLGEAMNDGFRKLTKKTDQFQILHNIAISLHGDITTEELLNLILDRVSKIIKSDVAAIALYDDAGRFRKLITHGATIKTKDALPEGIGLLNYLYHSRDPVRIDNVLEHPSFSGSFPEGHPVIKNLLAYPIFSDEGKPMGALYFGNNPDGFTEDDEMLLRAISADATVALSKAESVTELKRFKEVIDSAFDVILITDSSGNIIYVNRAFEDLTGYSKKDAIGQKTSLLKSGYHDNDFYKSLWETIKSGKTWKGDFINKKKSGDTYYASAIITPIHTEEGFHYASIQRDVTQEKRLYEQLLRAQKMESIGTLAGGIAHDFNNLLTAILGYSEIMLAKTTEGDQFYKPVSIINNAAEKGAELARKILMVTRKEKMETRPVNLNEVILSCMELLERSMPKNIEIITSLSDDIPLINADPTQIQQVVMNLAVNARDAMPQGGKLTIETDIVGRENGAVGGIPIDSDMIVKLAISDTGSGIDVDTQRKIFDPFFTTKELGKGTGLGLYMVHSIVSNHCGYINLYSEQDKGTRFNIYLPISTGSGKEGMHEVLELSGSETILVIDDEPDIRELSRDMLEPLGYKTLLAGSGYEGINIFRMMKDDIALVILDMVMPKMGGSEVFQALKNIKPDAKVLLCSGFSHDGFGGIDSLIRSGACGFVQKPFTRQSIVHAIKKSLA